MLFSMVSFQERHGLTLRPRLKRLHEVQEEIYRQLQLLLPDQVAHHDSFCSRVSGSPLLRLDILERHPYTQFLRLTYSFERDGGPELAPDAHIRMYQDARMAEVTAYNHHQGCRRSAHPWYPHRQLFQRIWRQNRALDKWLGYLLQQGHSLATMHPASDCIRGKQAVPMPVLAT
jgi:uncharacterized protein YqiB (DUF1249 family)